MQKSRKFGDFRHFEKILDIFYDILYHFLSENSETISF